MKIFAINSYNNVIPFRSNNSVIQNSLDTTRCLDTLFTRDSDDVYINFVYGELDEFVAAVKNNDKDNMEEEIGDVLFDTIMLANHYNIDPQKALERTNKKINDRISTLQEYAIKPMIEYSLDERLHFWDQAKKDLSLKT